MITIDESLNVLMTERDGLDGRCTSSSEGGRVYEEGGPGEPGWCGA